ncbi:TOG array regulator of axonemal microtubules protein 2-like [Mugil cephalus]|uniref:TOG array regulator of axonemal microtubules protein 2-like n=1 Tax=Mugil cephalus TaxID=48193 RepID=UPI001FB651D4|nr:TOG array regulator of axonemal microtubules protein 2-like [Mugil cephalus]
MDTVISLCVHLKKDMDGEAEMMVNVLLLKTAQASASSFIQQKASSALEALVQNCSAARVLNVLLTTGMSHRNAAVRASTAQQLHLLADRLGADKVLKGQSFLTAVGKICLDASAEVRPHGHAVLRELVLHKDFTKMWKKTIGEKDRCSLRKILIDMMKG